MDSSASKSPTDNFRVTTPGLLEVLEKIPGGYVYMGAASYQVCFPLKSGGELRFGLYDDDEHDGVAIDLYGGELPPCITGPGYPTGKK